MSHTSLTLLQRIYVDMRADFQERIETWFLLLNALVWLGTLRYFHAEVSFALSVLESF